MNTVLEPDLLFFLVAIPATLFAGISKGGFGSGAAFAATPMLALILEPSVAVALMLPLLMVMDVSMLKPYWGKWHWPNARVLIAGAVPGTILGLLIFGLADADSFRIMIGLVALLFLAYRFFRFLGWISVRPRPFNPVLGVFWGMIAGITSFISHAGGPAVAVHLLSQKMDKTTYQATSVVVFWISNTLKFVAYSWLGILTWQTLLADIYLVPAALLGTGLGIYAHRIVPERVYFAIVYTALLLAGSKLLYDGLT